MMKEQLRIAELCRKIGFTIEAVRQLLKGITLSIASGKLYSSEHKQYFEVTDAKMKIEKEPDNPDKLRLTINGTNIIDWFKLKYKELQQRISFNTYNNTSKNKGVRL
jgi:archaellum component FlaF (FlaF/FlaG flagellin family)